jgi:hypothetical protein
MPIGAMPCCEIIPLTTRLVEVLINVTELLRIEEKASGNSSLEGLMLARRGKHLTEKS